MQNDSFGLRSRIDGSELRRMESTETPLSAALALVAFGPARASDRPQDWVHVASPMCKYCREHEDVNLAAARIIADYVTALESVCESEQLARAQSALANVPKAP